MAGGTSVAYLTDRLRRAGREDLLAAVAVGELSVHAAAEAAGFIRQRATLNGITNQARRRRYAVMRATGVVPPLPEPPPQPAQPKRPPHPAFRDVLDIRSPTKPPPPKPTEPPEPWKFDPKALIG
jgi:hypothetical protein